MVKKWITKITATLIPLLLLVLIVENQKLKRSALRKSTLLQDIDRLDAETQKLLVEAKVCREKMADLPENLAQWSVSENAIEWCIHELDRVSQGTTCKLSFYHTEENIPLEMQFPRGVYNTEATHRPYLAPYSLLFTTTGTLNELSSLFDHIEHSAPIAVVGNLELASSEEKNVFRATGTLLYPKFLHAEDQEELNQFLDQ